MFVNGPLTGLPAVCRGCWHGDGRWSSRAAFLWLWRQGHASPTEHVSVPSCPLEELATDGVSSPLQLAGRFWTPDSVSSLGRPLRFLFLESVLEICVHRTLCHPVTSLVAGSSSSYCLLVFRFHVCDSDVPTSISAFSYLCLFFFFLVF